MNHNFLTPVSVSIALYTLGCICRCINPGKCITPNGIIILATLKHELKHIENLDFDSFDTIQTIEHKANDF